MTTSANSKDAAPSPGKTTLWETIVKLTPVAMTVIATILAGLSSSEMGRAQYNGSLAAQWQSKVSDQWNFYQAKRAKQSAEEAVLMQPLLEGHNVPPRLEAPAIQSGVDRWLTAIAQSALPQTGPQPQAVRDDLTKVLGDPSVQAALNAVAAGKPPEAPLRSIANPKIAEVVDLLEHEKPEADDPSLIRTITDLEVTKAIAFAEEDVRAVDASTAAIGEAVGRVQAVLLKMSQLTAAAERAAEDASGTDAATGEASRAVTTAARQAVRLNADLSAAMLRFDSVRHKREAAATRVVARLFEVEIRVVSYTRARHLARSSYFFYGMLGAQAAVTLASLALAVRERSVFWSIATALGTGAIAFGGYVYLYK